MKGLAGGDRGCAFGGTHRWWSTGEMGQHLRVASCGCGSWLGLGGPDGVGGVWVLVHQPGSGLVWWMQPLTQAGLSWPRSQPGGEG